MIESAIERRSVEDALPELYRQLRRRMEWVLYRYRIPMEDGEDLIQTVLLLALGKWPEVRDPAGWIMGTLAKRCILYWRAQRLEAERRERLADLLPEPVIEASQGGRMLRVDLATAARCLSVAQRRLLVLRFQLGLEPREVAQAMGLARNSIRKTTQRTLAALREQLNGTGWPRSRQPAEPGTASAPPPAPTAWAVAIDAYLAASGLAASSREPYRRHLIAAGAVLGRGALADLGPSDLAAYRAALRQDGRAATTHRAARCAVRAFLRWARGQGLHSVEGEVIRSALRDPRPGASDRDDARPVRVGGGGTAGLAGADDGPDVADRDPLQVAAAAATRNRCFVAAFLACFAEGLAAPQRRPPGDQA